MMVKEGDLILKSRVVKEIENRQPLPEGLKEALTRQERCLREALAEAKTPQEKTAVLNGFTGWQ